MVPWLNFVSSNNMYSALDQEEKDISQLKVLVAEDNAINVLLLRKMLGGWQIIPTVVSNGLEAFGEVVNHDFDVVLMDINMPVMDGFEASKMIRALKDFPKARIPIIAVTASGRNAFEENSDCCHLDDIILKPVLSEILRLKLETLDTYSRGTYR